MDESILQTSGARRPGKRKSKILNEWPCLSPKQSQHTTQGRSSEDALERGWWMATAHLPELQGRGCAFVRCCWNKRRRKLRFGLTQLELSGLFLAFRLYSFLPPKSKNDIWKEQKRGRFFPRLYMCQLLTPEQREFSHVTRFHARPSFM